MQILIIHIEHRVGRCCYLDHVLLRERVHNRRQYTTQLCRSNQLLAIRRQLIGDICVELKWCFFGHLVSVQAEWSCVEVTAAATRIAGEESRTASRTDPDHSNALCVVTLAGRTAAE